MYIKTFLKNGTICLAMEGAMPERYRPLTAHGPADVTLIPLVRAAAFIIVLLLILAYLTGEEFQHTHALLGFGLAAVMLVWVGWELVRPHELGSGSFASAISAIRAALRHETGGQSSPAAVVAFALMLLVGVLGSTALGLLWLTHSVWPPAAVDEVHEAIAYLTLGLAIVFIFVVIIASTGHIERMVRKRFR